MNVITVFDFFTEFIFFLVYDLFGIQQKFLELLIIVIAHPRFVDAKYLHEFLCLFVIDVLVEDVLVRLEFSRKCDLFFENNPAFTNDVFFEEYVVLRAAKFTGVHYIFLEFLKSFLSLV